MSWSALCANAPRKWTRPAVSQRTTSRSCVTALLASIRQNEATVLPLVPGLATVLAQLAARRPTTTRVRMVTNTGAALTAPVAARLRQSFPDAAIRFMYGMTECKRITISDPDDDTAYPGSVGFPLPGTEVEVIGDNGESVPAGTVGQIVASGPHVMSGYWNDPKATAERFRLAPDARPAVKRFPQAQAAMTAFSALRSAGKSIAAASSVLSPSAPSTTTIACSTDIW
ncbi:MAG TPA: hypothetical protein DGT23_16635 [Micromonosporaceae bacterium]|nr:hypothetical protein [Micromonosporaceae bacterium]